ncbi:dual specificity phosphatase [Acrasis kona]|uniref:Dual specificity phosphatase n=1 Tax=Acrasis kona TaxID=1008807 RepID=A0AAW2YYH9_9EUKA
MLTYLTGDELVQLFNSDEKFAIIDVRDDDWVQGNIKGSMHIPSAQFDHTRAKKLAEELEKRNISTVIFHCHFSQQRGPSGAKKFSNVVEWEMPNSKFDVRVLQGGWGDFFRKNKGNDALIERHDDHDEDYYY